MALDPSQIPRTWKSTATGSAGQPCKLLGGSGGQHFMFSCIAQCPATCWAHTSSGQVPCWLADNRLECVDRKHMFVRYCICQQLETGVWGTEVGRGKGKKGMQGAWHEKKGQALMVTDGTGEGCSCHQYSLAFIEHFLCGRHGASCFTCDISFILTTAQCGSITIFSTLQKGHKRLKKVKKFV